MTRDLETEINIAEKSNVQFQPPPNAVDISPNQDGVLWKEILKEGIGSETPAPGSKMSVHYVGSLMDGSKFDSSRDRGEPFEFNLGKGSVIKAWDVGVATMKKGELAVLTCKSEYGYGASGSPPKIPPNATLVFEVEVLDWQGEDLSHKKDGGIIRYQIEKGEGYTTPNDGALVEVNIIGRYNGREFENREVSFNLGEGSEHGICDGIERAIEKFKQGEKSRIILKPQYAFKETGKPECEIPPHASVEYELHLKRFEKAKECWSLDSEGKIQEAKLFKEKGTNFFKSGKYKLALKMYKKMNTFLDTNTGFDNVSDIERKVLVVVGHLNIAMCHLKLDEFVDARDSCNKALETDPDNLKGLFRRGQANLSLGEPEKAHGDFEMALKLEPTNKAAANQLIQCKIALKEQRGKEKQIYANMFEKFAQRDREDPNKCIFGWWDNGKVLVQEDKFVPVKAKREPLALHKKMSQETNEGNSGNDIESKQQDEGKGRSQNVYL